MFDCNAHDPIIADQEYLDLLSRAQAWKRVELIETHIQRDEISAIRDEEKRLRIVSVYGAATTACTVGVIEGVSRPGWADEDPNSAAQELLGDKIRTPNNWRDALQVATLGEKCDLFVTNDVGAAKMCAGIGSVMGSPAFKEFLRCQ